MSDTNLPPVSPRWHSNVKLIFGLTFAALFLGLLFYFRGYVGPLILAFMVTYLLHPVAAYLQKLTRLSWRINVIFVYLVLLAGLIALSTWLGVIIVQQVDSLYNVVVKFISDLPGLIEQLSSQRYFIGPFEIDVSRYLALNSLADQLLQMIQPALGQTTGLIGDFATRAATIIGLVLFILLISYFLLSESGKMPNSFASIEVPGYDADIRRLGRELSQIWNAFLRGQLFIMLMVTLTYSVILSILGVRFAIGIAILAGVARFVPYLGGFITWLALILASFFQVQNHFGLQPMAYTVLVIVIAVIVDQIYDNFISPQIMGQTLKVHPATVLLGAVIAASLLGLIGVVLAAPVVASLKLFGGYAFRKMFDLDPWSGLAESASSPVTPPGWLVRYYYRLRVWWRKQKH